MILFQPIVLVFQHVHLFAKLLDSIVQGLNLNIFFIGFLFQMSECSFELVVKIVRVGFQLGYCQPEIFAFRIPFPENLYKSVR